ncbi:hypothetical protein C8J57DRAFT_1517641 [Mycena rebaudengoi]|nr:hypothetical protein C8J57DRAFT_1517641 [Mycena rebaudengoi]
MAILKANAHTMEEIRYRIPEHVEPIENTDILAVVSALQLFVHAGPLMGLKTLHLSLGWVVDPDVQAWSALGHSTYMAVATEDPFDMGLGRASRISAFFYPLIHFHVLQNHHSSLVLHTNPSDLMRTHQNFSLSTSVLQEGYVRFGVVLYLGVFSIPPLPGQLPPPVLKSELSINSDFPFTGHLSIYGWLDILDFCVSSIACIQPLLAAEIL